MYFSPPSALNLPVIHFDIEATSLFCLLITSDSSEVAKGFISTYQLSDKLANFMPSLLNSEPDPALIHNYIQNLSNIDTANDELESNLLIMILMRLYDYTEDRETRSLMIELSFSLLDKL